MRMHEMREEVRKILPRNQKAKEAIEKLLGRVMRELWRSERREEKMERVIHGLIKEKEHAMKERKASRARCYIKRGGCKRERPPASQRRGRHTPA